MIMHGAQFVDKSMIALVEATVRWTRVMVLAVIAVSRDQCRRQDRDQRCA